MVAIEAGNHQSPLAHPAKGLLQAHHAAEVGGAPHGAAQVAAQGGVGDAGRHVGAAPAAGPAGYVVQVPGVVNRAVMQVVRSWTGSKLLQVFLSQDDGPSLFAPGDHQGVFRRHMVRQDLGAHGAADAGDGDVVLDTHGYSVQRPPVFAPHQGLFLLLGLASSLVMQDGDERVQCGLKPVGSGQSGLGKLDGRNFSGFDFWRQLGDGELAEVRIGHQSSPPSFARSKRDDITLDRSNSLSFSTWAR